MLQFLQKSHRCVMQMADWEKSVEKCTTTAKQSLHLADSRCHIVVLGTGTLISVLMWLDGGGFDVLILAVCCSLYVFWKLCRDNNSY